MSNDKSKQAKLNAIKSAMKGLEKTLKKSNTVYMLGDRPEVKIECTPSGSLTFDIALGAGIPRGRVIESLLGSLIK